MGDYLVDHKSCRFINFTGSKEVGIGIGAAGRTNGLPWRNSGSTRAFLEMGGKSTP